MFKACRILEAVEKAGWKREDVGASRYLMSEATIGRTKRRGKKDFLGGEEIGCRKEVGSSRRESCSCGFFFKKGREFRKKNRKRESKGEREK